MEQIIMMMERRVKRRKNRILNQNKLPVLAI